MATDTKCICLLTPFVGEYYCPVNWQKEAKARNYIARISWNEKRMFDRTFLKNKVVDETPVFLKADFVDGDIIEQKCIFVKGKKEEITFQGFFIVRLHPNGIYGEPISQKDALEYFQGCQALPQLDTSQKTYLKAKLSQVFRVLQAKYPPELISETLLELMAELLPAPTESPQVPS